MEVLVLGGLVFFAIAAVWLISMPFRRIAQENTFERMLEDPEVQELLYIAVARAHARRKRLAAQKSESRAAGAPPRGRIARLIWEAEKEGDRIKQNVLEELHSESD